ncbi:MAG: PIN domain-containing protein [Bacteroidota bacterium]
MRNYSALEKRKLEQLLEDCIIIDINPEIKKLTIQHRLKNNLKLPDAIIAASSQYLSFPLLTADKDFNKVKEIDILFYEKS